MPNPSWPTDNPLQCPLVQAIAIIGGKWKPIILHLLSSRTHRFGEIKKNIAPISQKVLTQQLRELELDGLVQRKVHAEIPPHVDYSLTPQGQALRPIMDALYAWGTQHNTNLSVSATGVITTPNSNKTTDL